MTVLITTQVRANYTYPDGSPVAGARVVANLSRYESDNGLVVPASITTYTDENGVATLALWPNTRGVGGSTYSIYVVKDNKTIWSGTVIVPELTTIVDVHTILQTIATPSLDAAQVAVLQAQEYAAQAAASAEAAASYGGIGGGGSGVDIASVKDVSSGIAGLTQFKINLLNALGLIKSFITTLATSPRTYTFPDKDITVAGLSDITGTNSGTNTGDETAASIKTKLGITTISGDNTGDESTATIKSKLGVTVLSGSNTGDQTLTSLGIPNVENKSSATIRSEITSINVTTALGYTPTDDTYAKMADRVERDGKMLRRAIDSVRYAPVTENRQYAYTSLNAAKKTNTDGGNKTVWEPDGAGAYGAAWTRDQAMFMEGYLDYFSADEIASVANYILSKSNLGTGEVPDHISHSGTVYWTPGSSNNWGSRAPIDGNTYLLQMYWLHFVKTGDASLYNSNKTSLKSLIESGIPYNNITGCVTINNTTPFVGFGFYDTVKVTGDVLFPSVLAYRAFLQLAEMEYALGNTSEAVRLQSRADTIKNGINSTLRNYYDVEFGSPNYVRKLAFYKAATIKGSGQLDMWGTLFAVWSDIPEGGFAKMIASDVVGIVSDVANVTVYQGAVRHVVKSTDYSAGTQSWSDFYSAVTFGTYQNGGFWHTPTPWLCYTLALVDPSAAKVQYDAMIASMQAQSVSVRPLEWFTNTGGSVGAGKYGTSAVAPLMCGDSLPYATSGVNGTNGTNGTNGVGVPVGGTTSQALVKNSNADYDTAWATISSGGTPSDYLSPLVNGVVSITGAITLDSTAWGKRFICSGTSADYTITLPTCVGQSGKSIEFQMASGLTVMVTLDGNGSELVAGATTRKMWANESAKFFTDGANLYRNGGTLIPMSAVMRRNVAQSVTRGAWTKISMDTVVRDNTSALISKCADTTNGYFKVLRPGIYSASGFSSVSGVPVGLEVNGGVAKNAAAPGDNPNAFTTVPAPTAGYVQINGSGQFECVAGDFLNTISYVEGTGTVNTRAVGTVYPTLSVTEVLTW